MRTLIPTHHFSTTHTKRHPDYNYQRVLPTHLPLEIPAETGRKLHLRREGAHGEVRSRALISIIKLRGRPIEFGSGGSGGVREDEGLRVAGKGQSEDAASAKDHRLVQFAFSC